MTFPCVDTPLRAAARRFAGKTVLMDGARSWTFAELDAVVDRLAGALAGMLPVEARCALFMANAAEYVIVQLALERAGLVRVPVNMRATTPEVAHILADSESALVFCDDTTAPLAAAAAATVARPVRCVVVGGDEWQGMLAAEPIVSDRGADLDRICSINYTSGSTGRPKGVVLTARNWRAVYKNMLIDRRIDQSDVVAHIGPLTHAAGTYVTPCLLRGAANVVVPGGRLDALFGAIARHRVTGFTCVPTVLTRIVNHPDLRAHDLSSLRWIGFGAEPIPHNTLAQAIAHFGPILTQNYGLTEAMMTCALLGPDEMRRPDGSLRTGCIGRAYTFVDLVLRAPDGTPVAAGEIGELTIRAEHVMREYWRRPEETAQTLRDGWLWSGDLARLDGEDGFYYLTGRSKDMIISGGFNIYPQEVERVISNHPDVVESAVIGVVDDEFGEAAVAFVACRAGAAVAAAELSEHCKPELGFKTPRQWRMLDALPKTPNGKIDKNALRAQLAEAGHGR